LNFVKGSQNEISVNLKSGNYFLLVELLTESNAVCEVSAYGSAELYFVRDEKAKYPLSEVMHSLMTSFAEQRKVDFERIAPDITCFKYTDIWAFGYACEYFENNSSVRY
jgi:hypothetical protein